jgi:hypothetical protein
MDRRSVAARVARTVDEIFANRQFDATKHIVPVSPVGHRTRARVPLTLRLGSSMAFSRSAFHPSPSQSALA